METAKIFMNGGSQAVRLPKAYSFPNMDEVYIHRCGNKIILEPIKHSWANLQKGIEMLPPDFNFERSTPDYSAEDDLFD
jgi:antitoxin VapB